MKSLKSHTFIVQKMNFSIKDFFSKCDQILGNLRIWSHLLKKSCMFKYVQVEDYQNVLKIKCKPLALASYKVILENKRCGTRFTA